MPGFIINRDRFFRVCGVCVPSSPFGFHGMRAKKDTANMLLARMSFSVSLPKSRPPTCGISQRFGSSGTARLGAPACPRCRRLRGATVEPSQSGGVHEVALLVVVCCGHRTRLWLRSPDEKGPPSPWVLILSQNGQISFSLSLSLTHSLSLSLSLACHQILSHFRGLICKFSVLSPCRSRPFHSLSSPSEASTTV